MRRFTVLALFVLATSWWGATMLRRLATARAETAQPVAAHPGDAVAALEAAAATHQLTIVRLGVAAGRTEVAMTGAERPLRAAIADLESGRPAIRFLSWRVRPEAGSADRLRFEGAAMAAAR